MRKTGALVDCSGVLDKQFQHMVMLSDEQSMWWTVVDTWGHAVGCCEIVPCDKLQRAPQERLQKVRLRDRKYLTINIAHVVGHCILCVVYP